MEKEIKKYKTNLIVIFICYIITILTNTHLFNFSSTYRYSIYFADTYQVILRLIYAITLFLLTGLSLTCIILIKKNLMLSTKIATKIGPMISIIAFFEGFNYGNGLAYIANFRILGYVFIFGSILIFNNGKKIKKALLNN